MEFASSFTQCYNIYRYPPETDSRVNYSAKEAIKVPESNTPQLDELEKGPWPSFVKEIKRAGKKKASARDLLGQLELSYKTAIRKS